MKKIAPYLAGLLMSLVFGLSFLFSKRGLVRLEPMTLVAYRFTFAALTLSALVLFRVIKVSYKGKPVSRLILLSVFYPFISFVLEITSLKYVSTSQAGIMISIMPIFVAIIGFLMLNERPPFIKIMFMLMSVAGVLVTVAFSKAEGGGSAFGITLMLISVICCSVQSVMARKYSVFFTPSEISFIMIWLGAIFFNIISITQGIFNGRLVEMYVAPFTNADALISVLYLGICASVIAFFCLNFMMAKLPAFQAAVFVNLTTVVTIVTGIFINNERLTWYQLAGGILIIGGVLGVSIIGTLPKDNSHNENSHNLETK